LSIENVVRNLQESISITLYHTRNFSTVIYSRDEYYIIAL